MKNTSESVCGSEVFCYRNEKTDKYKAFDALYCLPFKLPFRFGQRGEKADSNKEWRRSTQL